MNMPPGLDGARAGTTNGRTAPFAPSPPRPKREQMLLLTQQTPEEQKKARNRLAQRKHRERKCVLLIRARSSAYSRGHQGLGKTQSQRPRKKKKACEICRSRCRSLVPLGKNLGGAWLSRKAWRPVEKIRMDIRIRPGTYSDYLFMTSRSRMRTDMVGT